MGLFQAHLTLFCPNNPLDMYKEVQLIFDHKTKFALKNLKHILKFSPNSNEAHLSPFQYHFASATQISPSNPWTSMKELQFDSNLSELIIRLQKHNRNCKVGLKLYTQGQNWQRLQVPTSYNRVVIFRTTMAMV